MCLKLLRSSLSLSDVLRLSSARLDTGRCGNSGQLKNDTPEHDSGEILTQAVMFGCATNRGCRTCENDPPPRPDSPCRARLISSRVDSEWPRLASRPPLNYEGGLRAYGELLGKTSRSLYQRLGTIRVTRSRVRPFALTSDACANPNFVRVSSEDARTNYPGS